MFPKIFHQIKICQHSPPWSRLVRHHHKEDTTTFLFDTSSFKKYHSARLESSATWCLAVKQCRDYNSTSVSQPENWPPTNTWGPKRYGLGLRRPESAYDVEGGKPIQGLETDGCAIPAKTNWTKKSSHWTSLTSSQGRTKNFESKSQYSKAPWLPPKRGTECTIR